MSNDLYESTGSESAGIFGEGDIGGMLNITPEADGCCSKPWGKQARAEIIYNQLVANPITLLSAPNPLRFIDIFKSFNVFFDGGVLLQRIFQGINKSALIPAAVLAAGTYCLNGPTNAVLSVADLVGVAVGAAVLFAIEKTLAQRCLSTSQRHDYETLLADTDNVVKRALSRGEKFCITAQQLGYSVISSMTSYAALKTRVASWAYYALTGACFPGYFDSATRSFVNPGWCSPSSTNLTMPGSNVSLLEGNGSTSPVVINNASATNNTCSGFTVPNASHSLLNPLDLILVIILVPLLTYFVCKLGVSALVKFIDCCRNPCRRSTAHDDREDDLFLTAPRSKSALFPCCDPCCDENSDSEQPLGSLDSAYSVNPSNYGTGS